VQATQLSIHARLNNIGLSRDTQNDVMGNSQTARTCHAAQQGTTFAPPKFKSRARRSIGQSNNVAAINHAQYYQARTVDAVPINTFCQLYPNGR